MKNLSEEARREREIPGKLEYYEGVLREVKNPDRVGWWRFHTTYDRNGYCDNPGRGY
jgi:hypothetical protein